MKVFNFHDPTQKSDFGTYCGRIVFDLLEKSEEKQYLEVVTILVPPEILVPVAISAQFERHCLCSTE